MGQMATCPRDKFGIRRENLRRDRHKNVILIVTSRSKKPA
jgi:hypothetical protein